MRALERFCVRALSGHGPYAWFGPYGWLMFSSRQSIRRRR